MFSSDSLALYHFVQFGVNLHVPLVMHKSYKRQKLWFSILMNLQSPPEVYYDGKITAVMGSSIPGSFLYGMKQYCDALSRIWEQWCSSDFPLMRASVDLANGRSVVLLWSLLFPIRTCDNRTGLLSKRGFETPASVKITFFRLINPYANITEVNNCTLANWLRAANGYLAIYLATEPLMWVAEQLSTQQEISLRSQKNLMKLVRRIAKEALWWGLRPKSTMGTLSHDLRMPLSFTTRIGSVLQSWYKSGL